MAAIDKIYATKAQYDEFVAWCKRHKPEALEFLWWSWVGKKDGEHPIANFPEDVDMWLWVNCPIEFVTDRIKEQYGLTGEPWAAAGE